MTRLRRTSAQMPGWVRRRCGRGFRYLDEHGLALDPADVERIKALVIPPAWTEVWICPDERGHLQVVGTDAAGRRQYLYHPEWRDKQDAIKFDRVLELAPRLPRVRRDLRLALRDGWAPDHAGVLALAVRLIDLGCFRLGSEESAEENGSYGLTTLERRHVRRDGSARVFCFEGKSGVEHDIRVTDPQVCAALDALAGRRRPDARLLSHRSAGKWVATRPEDINLHLGTLFRAEVTAKDFRTWHGTVAVAAALGSVERADSARARRRQVCTAIDSAAVLLGNTPTVARNSYVDPRVLDCFEEGRTIRPTIIRLPSDPAVVQDRLDRAVVRLLTGEAR